MSSEQIKTIFKDTEQLNSERVLVAATNNETTEFMDVKDIIKGLRLIDDAVKSIWGIAEMTVKIWSLSLTVLRYVIVSNTECVSVVWGLALIVALVFAAIFLERRLRIT